MQEPPRPGGRRRGVQVALLAAAAVIALAGCTGPTTPATPAATGASSPSTPSPTPETSTTPSPAEPGPTEAPTPAAPAFTEVDGRWCLADDAADCLTIALPGLVHDDHPDGTEYVYPAGPGDPGDPSSWSYAGMVAGADGCFETAVDGYPAASGAAFIYCPAGAVSSQLNDLVGDPSVDRVFITQEVDVMPYHRAAS